MKRCIGLLVLMLLLALQGIAAAADTGGGVIEGQVVNGTEGGGNINSYDITLETFISDIRQDAVLSGKTDAAGKFRFADLSTEAGYAYFVSIRYQGADYYSDPVVFGEGEKDKSVDVTVFESTESDESITIPMAHTIVYVDNGALLVKEYFLFSNGSDRTYIGGKKGGSGETLRFPLPDGAIGLQSSFGTSSLIVSADNFADTAPVLPGMNEIGYSYMLESQTATWLALKTPGYPIGSYDLLVNGSGINVECDQLAKEDPIDIQGQQYLRLSGSDLSAGTILEIDLYGSGGGGHGTVFWLVVLLIPAVCAFGIGCVLLRKRISNKVRSAPAGIEGTLYQSEQGLLSEIAQLDDEFEAGRISEDEYNRVRAEKKSQLLELMKGSQSAGSPDNQRG